MSQMYPKCCRTSSLNLATTPVPNAVGLRLNLGLDGIMLYLWGPSLALEARPLWVGHPPWHYCIRGVTATTPYYVRTHRASEVRGTCLLDKSPRQLPDGNKWRRVLGNPISVALTQKSSGFRLHSTMWPHRQVWSEWQGGRVRGAGTHHAYCHARFATEQPRSGEAVAHEFGGAWIESGERRCPA